MNGLPSRPYLYKGSRSLVVLLERFERAGAARERSRQALRGLARPQSGSCPLPCCKNDVSDGLPCPECRDALGPVLRLTRDRDRVLGDAA